MCWLDLDFLKEAFTSNVSDAVQINTGVFVIQAGVNSAIQTSLQTQSGLINTRSCDIYTLNSSDDCVLLACDCINKTESIQSCYKLCDTSS